ncbi:PD-(D/E)XK nuclease family protein, partial [Patescibacteria group bacterium]|nr:PD-(D/E)XK nuclease family protein [Patescibacteria group bacterium]
DQTIGVEKKITLKWGEYEIIGYIDRLSRDKKGVYYIHDYKSGSIIMNQEYADKDHQLALYSIAVKENHKEAKEVKLVWHFVAFGEDVFSKRTDKELKELKSNILELIGEVNLAEKEDNFPAQETMCEWCGFWKHCPKKKHLYKTEQLPKNEYLKEDGIKLAKKYIELAEKRTDVNRDNRIRSEAITQEMWKIEEAILIYAKKNNIEALNGGDKLVSINKKQDYDIPRKSYDLERYEELENLLQKTRYWSDISTIADKKLKELLDEKEIDSDLKKKILEIVPMKDSISLSIRKK